MSKRYSDYTSEPREPPTHAKVRTRVGDPQADLRRCYVAACKANWPPSIDYASFVGLTCGARGKRTGKPCPQKGLYANGRCRWHGGLSTGPITPKGKARSALNGSLPKGVRVGGSEPHDHPKVTQRVLRAGAADSCVRAQVPPPTNTTDFAAASPASEPPAHLRPLASIRACLTDRPGRRLTADRLVSLTGLSASTTQTALNLLVTLRQVRRFVSPNRKGVVYGLAAGR